MKEKAEPNLSWNNVKEKLSTADNTGLVALVKDMYALSESNKVFLHSRLGLGQDILYPYKAAISRWLSPNMGKGQEISVAKAKKAISDHKKAVGRIEGTVELMTYFCEVGIRFGTQEFLDDARYYDSLVKMFAQVLAVSKDMPPEQRTKIMDRLDAVRQKSDKVGYGIWEDMTALITDYTLDESRE